MGVFAEAAKVLVLNAGSSSLKFKLFNLSPMVASVGGIIERIGDTANSKLIAKSDKQNWIKNIPVADHVLGLRHILEFMRNTVSTTIDKEVKAVGHRVVHGLDIYQAVLLTDETIGKIKEAAQLAPLHNPPGLQGIDAAQQIFRGVPQVGVFDTAYHQTMPPHTFMYGLPYEYYEKYKIRRYGFHGTSHKYLVETAANVLGKPIERLNLITCHLGNGSSITAVKQGLSYDTSMGFTPLEGVMMGTRSGDMDPAVPMYLVSHVGLSGQEVDTILNKKSGLLGVCGNNDLRTVITLMEEGDSRGQLALDMFCHRIRKYIGAYLAALEGRVDAIIFSAGIGENSPVIRNLLMRDLEALGIKLDPSRNQAVVGGKEGVISSDESKIKILVIPTDEELSIAQQTVAVVNKTVVTG